MVECDHSNDGRCSHNQSTAAMATDQDGRLARPAMAQKAPTLPERLGEEVPPGKARWAGMPGGFQPLLPRQATPKPAPPGGEGQGPVSVTV